METLAELRIRRLSSIPSKIPAQEDQADTITHPSEESMEHEGGGGGHWSSGSNEDTTDT